MGATFLRNNLNKRSVGIDLKHPRGRELFLALAPHFDVVAENFKSGTMDRLGLGYEDVANSPSPGRVSVDLRIRKRAFPLSGLVGVRVDRGGDVRPVRVHESG